MILIKSIRDKLDESLPSLGRFTKEDGDQEFTALVEYSDDKNPKIQIRTLEREQSSSLAEIIRQWHGKSEPFNLIGYLYPLGNVFIKNCRVKKQSQLGTNSLTTLDFEELQYSIRGIPSNWKEFDCIKLTSNRVAQIWFDYSGFKLNDVVTNSDFNLDYRYPARKKLFDSNEFSINQTHIFAHTNRFGVYTAKEQSVFEFDFSESRSAQECYSMLEYFKRFLLFSTGQNEPITSAYLSLNNEYSLSHVINDPIKEDSRSAFTKHQFLVVNDETKHPFQELFTAWLEFEGQLPMSIDRYVSSYNLFIEEGSSSARRGFIEICSAVEIYCKAYNIRGKKGSFHEAVDILIDHIAHVRLRKCFVDQFGSYIASTRAHLLHELKDNDNRIDKVLPSTKIREFGVKLKVLYEITLLRDHFNFNEEEVYLRIKHPVPNMYYLNELV